MCARLLLLESELIHMPSASSLHSGNPSFLLFIDQDLTITITTGSIYGSDVQLSNISGVVWLTRPVFNPGCVLAKLLKKSYQLPVCGNKSSIIRIIDLTLTWHEHTDFDHWSRFDIINHCNPLNTRLIRGDTPTVNHIVSLSWSTAWDKLIRWHNLITLAVWECRGREGGRALPAAGVSVHYLVSLWSAVVLLPGGSRSIG